MKPIDLFHLGPQKSATTWLYHCLKEHPQIACAKTDALHYFDMHYSQDRAVLEQAFEAAGASALRVDMTPSYLRSPIAPARIYQENPNAKLMLCLRQPVERAFSHYWHEKKKQRFDYRFDEVLENYDLFSNWLEPGFYATHIERYLEYFSKEQLLCQSFDLLQQDPQAFLKECYAFLGVDSDFTPSMLHEKRNEAKSVEAMHLIKRQRSLRRLYEKLGALKPLLRPAAKLYQKQHANRLDAVQGTGRQERLQDYPDAVIEALYAACLPEIERLEQLLGMDLSHWKTYRSGGK